MCTVNANDPKKQNDYESAIKLLQTYILFRYHINLLTQNMYFTEANDSITHETWWRVVSNLRI